MHLKKFIDQNKEQIDIYELKKGHEERFQKKLKSQNQQYQIGFVRRYYKKLLLAASVIILISVAGQYYKFSKQMQAKDVEIQQNEQYFSEIIKTEIKQIKSEETPETQKVFDDAMGRINQLEKDYRRLVDDYRVNHDKYILNAMIENFQQRIDILQFVKQEIKKIKENKTRQNETHRA